MYDEYNGLKLDHKKTKLDSIVEFSNLFNRIFCVITARLITLRSNAATDNYNRPNWLNQNKQTNKPKMLAQISMKIIIEFDSRES